MADYTLGVEIKGDSSDMQEAFEEAKKSAEKLKKEMDGVGTSNKIGGLQSRLSDISKKAQEIGNKISGWGDKISGFGTVATATVTAPIVAAGVALTNAASDMDENLNKVDVAFGNNAKEVKAWADNATKQFGLSKNAALEATALFGDMATSMGLSTGEASSMATSLAGLAGDLSSFKNIDISQAMTALNGVFTGETESLKTLGIVMTDTNLNAYALEKGFGKTTAEMSQSEKVALRYAYVMDATKNAQGDYARTSDGTANSIRTFQAEVSNLAAELGQNLLPIITPLIQKATDMVTTFGSLDSSAQQKILAIAVALAAVGPALLIVGKIVSTVGTLVSAFGSLSGLLSTIAGAFGATGTAAGTAAGGMAAVGAGPIIAGIAAIAGVIAVVVTAFTNLWNKSETFRNSVGELIANVQAQFGKIAGTAQQYLEPVITMFQVLWDSLVSLAEPAVEAIVPLLSNVATIIGNVFTAIMAVVGPVFSWIISIITTTIQIVTPIIKSIMTVIIAIVSAIISIVADLTTFIADVISAMVAWIGPVIKPIVDFFGDVFTTAGTIIGDSLTTVATFISTWVGKASGIVKNLISTFSSVFQSISSIVSGIMESVGSKISGVFEAVKGAWSGLTGFVGGVFDGISSSVEALVNQVKGFVNGVIKGINTAIDVINKVPGVSISEIPQLYRGTDDWQGGFARMNEGGRGELTYLPNGSIVVPHDVSMKYARESARANQPDVVAINQPSNGKADTSILTELRAMKQLLAKGSQVIMDGQIVGGIIDTRLGQKAQIGGRLSLR